MKTKYSQTGGWTIDEINENNKINLNELTDEVNFDISVDHLNLQ